MPELNRSAELPTPNKLYARLGGKLGVPRLRSDRELALLVEKRLPVSVIKALMQGGLSDAEVYRLIVPRRTLAHRVAKHQPLSPEESDKAVRVARLAAMAEQVFGDSKHAWQWLREGKRRFDGKSPLAMLATETGARLVEELIIQIDDAMLA